MSSPVTPMLILGGVSYANNWYNTGNATNVKPLLFSGVAALFLSAFGAIPGMETTATVLGYTALAAMFISPIQNPSPIDNILKLTGGK